MAHVRDLGDREADENGWVGDKTGMRRRIEGFTLRADLSDWRDICSYQAVLPDGSLGRSVSGDTYCGTRGKSVPLHGFVVAVPQERPELECLAYEGVFADGFRSAQLRPGELCRSPSNAALVAMRISVATTHETADNAAKHDESRHRAENPDPGLAKLAPRHNGVFFLAPTDLSRPPPPTVLRRVALVGSCFLRAWNLQALAASTCAFDVFTINNAANLPDSPAAGAVVSDYDFQIVQLSMRSFFHDDMLTKLPYADIGAHEKALDDATQRMAFQLSCSMK
jgi:hypothetical protein